MIIIYVLIIYNNKTSNILYFLRNIYLFLIICCTYIKIKLKTNPNYFWILKLRIFFSTKYILIIYNINYTCKIFKSMFKVHWYPKKQKKNEKENQRTQKKSLKEQ